MFITRLKKICFYLLIFTLSILVCSCGKKTENLKAPEVNPESVELFQKIVNEEFGVVYSNAKIDILFNIVTNKPDGIVLSYNYASGYKIYKYTDNKFILLESSSANKSPYIDVPVDANIYYYGAKGYYYSSNGIYFNHTFEESSITYSEITENLNKNPTD